MINPLHQLPVKQVNVLLLQTIFCLQVEANIKGSEANISRLYIKCMSKPNK